MHSHTYQSGRTFCWGSHSKSVSEFGFPVCATDFMQGETIKVKNEDIQALFLQALAYRSVRTQP